VSSPDANIELVRKGVDAFNRGAIDESVADMHPEVEWHLLFRTPDLPIGKSVFRGTDEVREVWATFRSAWETLVVEIEEILHADDEHVVFRARFRGRGAGSGVEVDRLVYYHYRVTDGLLRYTRGFDDEAAAMRDAGVGGAA
jgi:ketosteroid isomerase-like protein